MSGERGSVAGIELLTRTSLNSLKDASQVYTSYLWETVNPQPMDDRNWSWSYLRHQFRLKDLEELYLKYQHHLHRGYFSVFIVVQIVLSLAHVIAILFSLRNNKSEDFVPDVVLYCTVAVLSGPLLVVVYRRQQLGVTVSIIMTVLMLIVDLGLVVYYGLQSNMQTQLRPAYTTYILLVIYSFLPIVRNRHAVVLGIIVSLCHLLVLASVTYKTSPNRSSLLSSEAVYMVCVNGLGLYFRFVNEVVIRRTFLDRRACVYSTLKLNYEKEQEEQLMLSILPKHIAARVKSDIRNIFQHIKKHQNTPLKKKPFSELYVEEHDNVTILYADVVNYSQLTVSLPATKLVETLNELFGRFDEASEERGVLRIKFLGDCYYCVSGVPQPNPQHARCCVDLGLDMIAIIKTVREQRNLNVDMRIGIHSGKILSGLLGVCKWQYDIWSRDVIIANHMEQTGKPGRVHVSKATLGLLGEDYDWEPGDGALKDPLLAQYHIETFLILPKQQHSCEVENNPHKDNRYSSSPRSSKDRGRLMHPDGMLPAPRRHTAQFMDNNLVMYQKMLKMADASMANAIEQMPIGNYKAWIGQHDVNPLCLTFHKLKWELPFLQQPDPLFKFYVAGALAVLLCMLIIQMFSMSSTHYAALSAYIFSAIVIVCILPFTWTHFLWNNIRDPHQEMDLIPEPKFGILCILYRASVRVVWSNTIRTLIYLGVTTMLSTCALIDLIGCDDSVELKSHSSLSYYRPFTETCLPPWHITETCSLAVLMCFLFLRVHFQLKLLISLCIVAVHTYSVVYFRPRLFQSGETFNPTLDPRTAHIFGMFLLILALHLMDRQAEYMNRLDYRWKRQLSEEQEEAATTRMVNKMLLQNILPIHVAEIYLNTSRPHEELYHEQYDSVAVMFASLTESTLDTTLAHELSSLEILNQIICAFDKLLFESTSLRVEKIKVGGRTYMAACGLEPGRRETSTIAVDTDHNLVVLTRFASNMMCVLNKFNRNNNHSFQLTVGIAHGAVTAGVVGSQKPLYDIWGDAVNVASRMDSTGLPGKIQVTEDTRKVLEDHNVKCELRGKTFVKGKDYLMTYFVSETETLRLCTLKNR